MENRGVLRGPSRTPGTLRAVSLSTHVEPLFGAAGVVLSVHGAAVNVDLDGRLVTVASARAGGLPNGILVADPFDPRSLGIRAGLPVALSSDRLEFSDAHVVVAIGAARRWSPELRPIPAPQDLAGRLAIARRATADAACVRAHPRGVIPTDRALARLAVAFSTEAESAVIDAGHDLIGLGPGLTPAGDDILVGLAAGLAAIGDPRARRLARAWARTADGRTSTVAESFHRNAADGAFSERLHDAARAILAGRLDAIPGAIRAAAAWGATSGTDTLHGLLLGLDQAGLSTAAAGPERPAA